MKFGESIFLGLTSILDITHTGFRANLVRWITENNRPVNILNDCTLRDLLLSGRPNIDVYFRKVGTFYTSLETACLRHQPVHSSVLAHGSAVIL